MADMELVIKISEDSYKAICSGWMLPSDAENVINAIKNGKELPKGHGRLIDADKYVKSICDACDGMCEFVGCDCLNCHKDCRCEFAIAMDNVDVLIEADKESDE